MAPHNYNVNLTWKADRKGEMSSPELNDKIEVATPPEFPKGIEGVWSPEHFFTAAVVSCFMTTFLAVAENSNLEFKSFECESTGVLDKVEGKFQMSEVILRPKLVLIDGSDIEKAEKILQKSERACLITNSIKTEVSLDTTIEVLASI